MTAPPPPPGTTRPIHPPPPRGGRGGLLVWLGLGAAVAGTIPIPPISFFTYALSINTSKESMCCCFRCFCNGLTCVGGYYLYTSGGNTTEARRKAEHDARYARERTLDGAERVGDKIDNAYDDVTKKLESKYKDAKGEFKKEYGKEKDQIGKQVEV
jgi:hypothetical protein